MLTKNGPGSMQSSLHPRAINISAVELRSKQFVEHVRAILQETGLQASYLEFELTETALMQDPQSTIEVLRELKDMGIKLTLDDFGTGYSSLSYLRRFPIDALKIDRSFVQGLCTNADDAKIVSAVINLGRSFHLHVIAEAWKHGRNLFALQGQGCAEDRAITFQTPVAANEFAKLLGVDLSTNGGRMEGLPYSVTVNTLPQKHAYRRTVRPRPPGRYTPCLPAAHSGAFHLK